MMPFIERNSLDLLTGTRPVYVMMPLFGGEGDEWTYERAIAGGEIVHEGIPYTVCCANPQDSPPDPRRHPYWFAGTEQALNTVTWADIEQRWDERVNSEEMLL